MVPFLCTEEIARVSGSVVEEEGSEDLACHGLAPPWGGEEGESRQEQKGSKKVGYWEGLVWLCLSVVGHHSPFFGLQKTCPRNFEDDRRSKLQDTIVTPILYDCSSHAWCQFCPGWMSRNKFVCWCASRPPSHPPSYPLYLNHTFNDNVLILEYTFRFLVRGSMF